MQFQSHYNRFLLSLEGTKNIYVSFCENIISFCAPRTFRFADYTRNHHGSQGYMGSDSRKWKKWCPCFDAKSEYKDLK